MADRIGHAPQNPDRAVGWRYTDKPGNPAHDKECEIQRLVLNLDRLKTEEWVSG
jgi:hypothetical protein